MAKDMQQMLAKANAAIGTSSVEDAEALLDDVGVLILDARELGEVEKGKIPGAVNEPRGVLEIEADPASPPHNSALKRSRRIIVICGSGRRRAFAGQTLLDMGFADVSNLAGGMRAWIEAGVPTE